MISRSNRQNAETEYWFLPLVITLRVWRFLSAIGTLKALPFKAKTPNEIRVLVKSYGMVYK